MVERSIACRWPRTASQQQRLRLLLLFIAGCVAVQAAVQAHGTGLYRTKAEAQQRAKELGCKGTHQVNNLWMPCNNEASLHHELRQE